MIEYFFASLGVAAVLIVWSFAMFCLGHYACTIDAEARLKGKRPIDDFWRRHGMRDIHRT
jgi:hypothetical protein